MTDWGALYTRCNQDFVTIAGRLSEGEWATVVPATPDWTVHDLVAHAAGTSTDLVNDAMGQAPADAWTARHVDERREASATDLAEELRATEAQVAGSFAGNDRPALAWDRSVHLADLHEALGLGCPEDDRWRPVFEAVSAWRLADLPALDAPDYEVFRALFTRRSRDQIRAWAPNLTDADLESIGVFGTREDAQPVP